MEANAEDSAPAVTEQEGIDEAIFEAILMEEQQQLLNADQEAKEKQKRRAQQRNQREQYDDHDQEDQQDQVEDGQTESKYFYPNFKSNPLKAEEESNLALFFQRPTKKPRRENSWQKKTTEGIEKILEKRGEAIPTFSSAPAAVSPLTTARSVVPSASAPSKPPVELGPKARVALLVRLAEKEQETKNRMSAKKKKEMEDLFRRQREKIELNTRFERERDGLPPLPEEKEEKKRRVVGLHELALITAREVERKKKEQERTLENKRFPGKERRSLPEKESDSIRYDDNESMSDEEYFHRFEKKSKRSSQKKKPAEEEMKEETEPEKKERVYEGTGGLDWKCADHYTVPSGQKITWATRNKKLMGEDGKCEYATRWKNALVSHLRMVHDVVVHSADLHLQLLDSEQSPTFASSEIAAIDNDIEKAEKDEDGEEVEESVTPRRHSLRSSAQPTNKAAATRSPQKSIKDERKGEEVGKSRKRKRDASEESTQAAATTLTPEFARELDARRKALESWKAADAGSFLGRQPYLNCTFPDCTYWTTKKTSFEKHLKTHTDDYDFKCALCDYGCFEVILLRNHIERVHADELDEVKEEDGEKEVDKMDVDKEHVEATGECG